MKLKKILCELEIIKEENVDERLGEFIQELHGIILKLREETYKSVLKGKSQRQTQPALIHTTNSNYPPKVIDVNIEIGKLTGAQTEIEPNTALEDDSQVITNEFLQENQFSWIHETGDDPKPEYVPGHPYQNEKSNLTFFHRNVVKYTVSRTNKVKCLSRKAKAEVDERLEVSKRHQFVSGGMIPLGLYLARSSAGSRY